MSSPVTTIAEIGKHEGQSVTIRGWLYNLRESGKLLFPQFRDGSGIIQGVVPKNAVPPEVFDAIKTLTQESSVIVEGKVRADKRAHGGYELDVVQRASRAARPGVFALPDHAQRARHRLPDGASPPLGAVAAPGGDSAGARRNHQGGARFLRRTRLHADRSAHHHSRRVRRHEHALSRRLFRRTSIPHAVRPACMWKRPRWRWARCIRSARRSARKNPRRAAISPSSGWSNRKSPTLNSTTSWNWPRASSASS
jgi:hypothetical protein